MHDFGITTIAAHPYTVAPTVFQSNLSASSWTNSTGSWTSYAGSTGEAIAISNSGGTPSIALSFTVAAGYKLNLTSFDFWQQRSTTGAQNWSMTVNGIAVGSGIVPTTGAAIGTMPVLNPVNNLSGTVTIIIFLSGASGSGTYRLDDFTLNGNIVPNAYTLLDNFNRNDSIRPATPSSGGPQYWHEVEVGICFTTGNTGVLSLVRIKNNLLEISGCTLANGTCLANPTSTANMDMSLRYPTVFSNAAGNMEWYFNMQQSRTDPNGFAAGQYGAAFVIGSNTNDPAANPKLGYAVIFGEAGTTDPVRLVSFNGNAFNSSTFTNILSVPSPAVKTNWMSVKVGYNPCTNEWSLTVRDDGASSADPATVSGVGATAINSTFTGTNLLWMGCVWNHGSSCDLAKFDNIYIPNTTANAGTYIWNGSTGTDFQSAYNWSPKRQCIKTTDKLLFNSSSPASSLLTNIPNQTIGQLTVTNNRTLTINDVAGDAAVSTLTIAGSTGTDLQVDAGSAILFDVSSNAAGDAMVINVATGATAVIAGTISFNSQFGGIRSHRLLADDPGGIAVNSGGLIKAMNLNGNPFGSSMPLNTVVFNNGSAYEYYSGANPFGLAQPDSKVLFNTGSVYRHYSNNQPSVLGRTYADFEMNGSSNITFGGAAIFTVNNFKQITGSFQLTGVSNSLPVNMDIKGNLVVSPGAAFVYDPAVASTCTFNSAGMAQKINSGGTLSFGKQLMVRLNSSFGTPPQLTVETDIAIAGALNISQGNLKLTGNITMQSNINGNAAIAPITGTITYGAGRFIIERYIPLHGKAWQFLAVPVTGQTVNAAWQEGNAPMAPGTAGLGTIITNNLPGTGFDLIAGAGPSMKTYDTTGTGSWKGISRTDTAIYNQKGYMLFVRGDRTVSSSAAAATLTTLRTTGKIFDPSNMPPLTNIGAGKFESAGNPYAAAIDFSNDAAVLKSANVQRLFYVWDPKLGGGNGFGGYQTFVKGAGTDYTVSPGGGSYPAAGNVWNTIQSGQAFFVHTFGGTGNVAFTENAKVLGSSLVTRTGNNGTAVAQLRTNLYLPGTDSAVLIDGVLNEFSGSFSNDIDMLDAVKAGNTGEGLGIRRDMIDLSVERHAMIKNGDSIPYTTERLKPLHYEFQFIPAGLATTGMQAFLIDHYLNTITQVSLSTSGRLGFDVIAEPASAATNRFVLVFKQKHVRVTGKIAAGEVSKAFIVYPNPVTGNSLRISFNSQPAGNYSIRIVDQKGQTILAKPVTVNSRQLVHTLSIPLVPAGTYQLLVTDRAGHTQSQQIIIQH